MKSTLIAFLALALLTAAGCTKKTTNETSGNKTEGKIETVEFKCAGMHCSGCEETITEEVKKIDGVKEIKADSKEKYVRVVFDAGKTNKENISKAINTAGYDTELSKSENKHDCEEDMKQESK
jgi:copper chaperone CopZ